MSNTALITGATGFIGYHLCNRLHNEGWEVIAQGTRGENTPCCSQFIESSLEKFISIASDVLPNIDICYHQAANNLTTDKNFEKIVLTNVFEPLELFEKLLNKNCSKFVYASSCSVYGNNPVPFSETKTNFNPLNPYAISKAMLEVSMKRFANKNKVKAVGLRYSNVYGLNEEHKGSRASIVSQLTNKMKKNLNPVLFNYGEQLRDWVHVDDVINANLLASVYQGSGVFNVGSGEAISFLKIVECINDELEKNLPVEFKECPFIESYQEHTLCDLSLSEKELGYKPLKTAEESIRDYIREIKKATD